MIHWFPPLDDLCAIDCDPKPPFGKDPEEQLTAEQSPPAFIGSLELYLNAWTGFIAQLLLRSSSGHRFRRLDARCKSHITEISG